MTSAFYNMTKRNYVIILCL